MATLMVLTMLVDCLAVHAPEARREDVSGSSRTTRNLQLVADTVYGEALGPDLYGQPIDVCLLGDRFVYVLDRGFRLVHQFSIDGSFIASFGGEGSGPGYFEGPTAICSDDSQRVFVADRAKIEVFSFDGIPLQSKPYGFVGGSVQSLQYDSAIGLIAVRWDLYTRQLIHVFDSDFQLLRSFSPSYAVAEKREVDVREERAYAGGHVCVTSNGSLAFAQKAPFEIRWFRPDGTMYRALERDCASIDRPRLEHEPAGIFFPSVAGSVGLVAMANDSVLHVRWVPERKGAESTTELELFDSTGAPAAATAIQGTLLLQCADRNNFVYGLELGDSPRCVRYAITGTEP